MGLFRKKGPEIIDYTLLEKRGFIKKSKEKKLPFKINSGGCIELAEGGRISKSEETATNNINKENQNPFNFLDNIARASSDSTTFVNNDVVGMNDSNSNLPSEFNSMKVKMDDLEYKLETFIEKLNLIEEKIANFERKVG